MKKNMFLLAAATVALASCSSEDVIELNNGNAIDFRAAMGVASRGEETTGTNIGKFYVTAIDGQLNYFTDELFSKKDGSDNIYVSETEYFWPGTHTLDFYAYSYYTTGNIDASKLGTVNIESGEQTIKGFIPNEDVAQQIDFVTAKTSTSTMDKDKGVQLIFAHNLIQTQVLAKTTNTAYKFEIAGVKFGNIASEGNFTFADTPQWDLVNGADGKPKTTDYTIEYDAFALDPEAETAVDLSNTKVVKSMMVLPQQLTPGDMDANKKNITAGAYIAVKLRITTTNSNKTRVYPYADNTEDFAWAYVPVNTNWVAGNRYVYTLDFSRGAGYDDNGDPILGDPIIFNATVTGWVEDSGFNGDTNMKVDPVKNEGSTVTE